MLGRTPFDAYRSFIEPVQSTFNTIAVGRLQLSAAAAHLPPGVPLDSYMNNGVPMPMRSSVIGACSLQVAIRAQVEPLTLGPYRFQCVLQGYLFALLADNDREILAFHWAPEAPGIQRSYPHMHIGAALSSAGNVAEDRFHKLHVPTSILSSQHIARFAIQELGVSVRPGMNRDAVLADLSREIGDS
jgi:hypothetical protein